MGIERIVIAVDFSEYSESVFEAGLDVARAFGAEVHLVHVIPDAVAFASPYEPSLPPEFDREIEEAASKHLGEWSAAHRPAEVAVSEHLKRGSPPHQITGLAEKLGADLIVIGTRGLTGLRHLLMGSVAERTLRTAPCPVLTVKGSSELDG